MRRWSTPFCNLNVETQQNIRDKLLLDRFLILVRDIGKLIVGVLLQYFPSFFVDNFHLSWIFKSMSDTTADATASVANKTRIFKWKMEVVSRKYSRLTGSGKWLLTPSRWVFPKCIQLTTCIFHLLFTKGEPFSKSAHKRQWQHSLI